MSKSFTKDKSSLLIHKGSKMTSTGFKIASGDFGRSCSSRKACAV